MRNSPNQVTTVDASDEALAQQAYEIFGNLPAHRVKTLPPGTYVVYLCNVSEKTDYLGKNPTNGQQNMFRHMYSFLFKPKHVVQSSEPIAPGEIENLIHIKTLLLSGANAKFAAQQLAAIGEAMKFEETLAAAIESGLAPVISGPRMRPEVARGKQMLEILLQTIKRRGMWPIPMVVTMTPPKKGQEDYGPNMGRIHDFSADLAEELGIVVPTVEEIIDAGFSSPGVDDDDQV